MWVARYSGHGRARDTAFAVATGSGGGVFVTGSSAVSASQAGYETVAYGG